MKLFLIRHGETEYNKTFRFLGRTDVGLSEKGIEQARRLAGDLSSENITAIYTSDMLRARQTAEIIAEPHGATVTALSDLREIDFGRWEGLTYDEIMALEKDYFSVWIENPFDNDIPEGESWAAFKARLLSAVGLIIDSASDGKAVIVSHGGPIRFLVTHLNNHEEEHFKNFWPQPGSLTILNIQTF